MIFENIQRDSALPSLTMMRSTSPPQPRSSSPAMSEISVGSPSPPPPVIVSLHHAFRPLNMKRVRLSHDRSQSPSASPQPPAMLSTAPLPPRRKSVAERVKSFSIADILGEKDEVDKQPPQQQQPPSRALLPVISERLQAQPPSATQLLLDAPPAKVVHPWDPVRGPLAMRPFFPPALLHYEQRLAWDYQRQLQEHFQAQAQLLRQMSMDPTIIPSEDGSERSRSSSTGSDCCSPEVNVSGGSVDQLASSEAGAAGGSSRSNQNASHSGESSSKKSTGDTPLDALFQLSTKNFDEEQDPATLNIFATRPNPKKKRKSRTAFTNHQIFELEKRFLYQKYLSPADRDEIAGGLGLSNAQVITWFQNRRAKLKRDMEELKKDVESVKQLPDQSAEISQQQRQHLQQQQRQYMAALSTQHAMLHYPPPQPHTLTQAASTSTLTAETDSQPKQIPRVSNSTAAEDKKEIKMLKMMTLMYYSSRSGVDVGNNNPPAPATMLKSSNCSASAPRKLGTN